MAPAIFRYSTWDGLFVLGAAAHAALILSAPSIPAMAILLWWNANTIAHNFIHLPFFRSRAANRVFSGFLSLVLGIPQQLWRQRHLAHHADARWQLRITPQLFVETALVLALWACIAGAAPMFFLKVYLPGWALGLALCQVQGLFEHAHGTISHYGRWYNWLFFNDGFHVEHHARPRAHWRDLPSLRAPQAQRSRWPAVLRFLDWLTLSGLERLVLRSSALQSWVLKRHELAIRAALPPQFRPRRIVVVGGGLFPRSALVLGKLFPGSRMIIIEQTAGHIESAQRFLGGRVQWRHEAYCEDSRLCCDLAVFPLAFDGNRRALYVHPPAPFVLVHDWVWRRRGRSALVSMLLLKRVNCCSASSERPLPVLAAQQHLA